MVACNPNPATSYTCAGPEDVAVSLIPSGNFQVDLGPNPAGNPFIQTVIDSNPALAIYAYGQNTINDGVVLYPNSSITNEDGIGMAILDPGQVDLNLWSNDEADPASIVGTTGLYIGPSEDGYGGQVHINNNGHIEGTDGAAIEATGGTYGSLIFELDNHSYQSIIGDGNGVDLHNNIIWSQINNGGGLIAGLGGDGINIDQTNNSDWDHPAIQINNNGGGVIAGAQNGVQITVVAITEDGNPDIVINNDPYYDYDLEEMQHGGLIVGLTQNGVDVEDTIGSVYIRNSGTWGDPADLSVLDPKVYTNSSEDGSLLNGAFDLAAYSTSPPGPSRGIWGGSDGIHLDAVGGDVVIDNGSYWNEDGQTQVGGGLIVGVTDDAVQMTDIGWYNEDGYETVSIYNQDGMMWGADNGVQLSNIYGGVGIDNTSGAIFGVGGGVEVIGVTRGDVWIENDGGSIEGFHNDAIYVSGVTNEDGGGWVGIFNGLGEGGFGDGGLIMSADRAIYVSAEGALIGNGVDGLIVGEGSWSQPVIELNTSTGGNNQSSGAGIINYGLMTSDNLPYFDREWSAPGIAELPSAPLDGEALASLQADHDNLNEFAWTGGKSGGIENLGDYAAAASDVLVKASGGANYIENDGVMIGRLVLRGHTDSEDGWIGNTVVNMGTWLTVDGGGWGNTTSGSSHDQIQNGGLIQTAFRADVQEETDFYGVNDFYNGSLFNLYGILESQAPVATPGLVSMIDGGTGDYTYIDHNFHGSDGADRNSFIGLDVNFGPGTAEDPEDWNDPSLWRADRLEIEDTITGTTGLIIHKTNVTSTSTIGDIIEVAYAQTDGNTSDQQCYEVACKDGDTMYIAAASQGYIDVGGVGAIQDGLYAWYLKEVGTAPDPDFVLESEWAPQTVQLPSVITGAQDVWHDVSGQVADHVYGTHFPLAGGGGGGADLAVGAEPIGPSARPETAIWGKVTGSWTDRNTSVQQSLAGPPPTTVNIDTSLLQHTYALIGGADFAPTGADDGMRFGVFGGYETSGLSFSSYGASADYSGGMLGAYAAYSSGGFYVDAEAKADLLNVTYRAPFTPAFESSGFATSLGFLANTGYRVETGAGFFEPLASLSFVSTSVDGFSAGGAAVDFNNGQSLQAGAGIRVGTTFATPKDTTTEVALLAKVSNEFNTANQVTISDGLGGSATFSDNIAGAFGELSASATAYSNDRSFSAFVSAGGKFNADFTTIDAKAGVRKTF